MVALSVLAFARSAAAFPSSRLVYMRGPGAEQCPTQDAVRKAVASRLGYDPFFPSSDKIIVARVLRQADHLTGQVELVDERGVQVGLREFSAEPDHCTDLIRAMALSISIAIDPKSAETYGQRPIDEPPESAPEEPGTAAAGKEPEPGPAREPPARFRSQTAHAASDAIVRPARLQASAGIAALAAFRTAPTLTLGGALFGALRSKAWSVALEGRGDLPLTTEQGGVPLRIATYALSAVPCFHLGVGFACAVGSLRWLSVARTEPGANDGSRPFWAFGGRFGAELSLSRSFALLGYVDLQAAPQPPQVFAVSEPLWKVPVLSADLAIAGAVHFK